MSFSTSVRTCLSKYVTFSGRASRPEYWWFMLFLILGGIVASILDGLFFNGVVETGEGRFIAESEGPLSGLFSLATLLPALAAGWRRMHDTGRSGLYLLYPLIVMIGIGTFAGLIGFAPDQFAGLWALVFFVAVFVLIISPLLVLWWLTRPSQRGTNDWGLSPQSTERVLRQ